MGPKHLEKKHPKVAIKIDMSIATAIDFFLCFGDLRIRKRSDQRPDRIKTGPDRF